MLTTGVYEDFRLSGWGLVIGGVSAMFKILVEVKIIICLLENRKLFSILKQKCVKKDQN